MFCLEPSLRTAAREAVSQIALRDCSREVQGEPGDTAVFAGGRGDTVRHQKMTANHKKQISQINDFSAFLCVGRWKSLGFLKAFLLYASSLSRPSILFFSILNSAQGALWWRVGAAVTKGLLATSAFVY